MDEVFKALADPGRRQLLDSLNARNGQSLRELCAVLRMARQSVSKHLAVLEAADLVATVWRGREKLHYLNAAPINAIADRWIDQYHREHARALAGLKRVLEQETMGSNEFVYTTYINTTPERLWQAITDPAFTELYWHVTFETDWAVGSPMIWHHKGVTMADAEQVVVESDPYRRLAYTWHVITPEFAQAVGLSDEHQVRASAEHRSKVTFDIEQSGEVVKLTVIHSDFEPGSILLELVGQGWPHLISDLKTFLETGKPMPPAA